MFTFQHDPLQSSSLQQQHTVGVVLPCLEALLEVFFHEVLQCVGCSFQDIVNCPALMSS